MLQVRQRVPPDPTLPVARRPAKVGEFISPRGIRSQRPPYPSISLVTPVLPQQAESASESETGSKCEQSLVTAVDAREAPLASQMDSVVALDTGATANLVRRSWLAHRNSILGNNGFPKVTTYPSMARFRFGGGRLGGGTTCG